MRGSSLIKNTVGPTILGLSLALVSLVSVAGGLAEYKKLAKNTIEQAQKGTISNIDALIAQQATLVDLGVDACNHYSNKHPKAKHILDLVTSNANVMKQLSLSEIEKKWHHGGELKKHGYSVKDDHFGAVGNLIDAVIHPATTYIALNNYKKDKKAEYLQQVVAELSEVLVHLQYLE
jgi:hypothetical protein